MTITAPVMNIGFTSCNKQGGGARRKEKEKNEAHSKCRATWRCHKGPLPSATQETHTNQRNGSAFNNARSYHLPFTTNHILVGAALSQARASRLYGQDRLVPTSLDLASPKSPLINSSAPTSRIRATQTPSLIPARFSTTDCSHFLRYDANRKFLG